MLSLQIQPTTANRPRRARSGDARARRKTAVANEAHSYHPSLVNRIVAISSIDGAVNYTYGIGGNSAPELLRTADYSNAAIPDEVYNHDQNYNRILDSEHGAGFVYGPGNRLVSDGIYNYQYDHEGNMTRRTEIATGDYRVFNYDERNRLVALADYDFAGAALMTEQMSYDAFDRRITLQVDTAPGDGVEAAVTHFGYDGEDVIVDAVDPDGASGPSAAAVETTYLHGAGIDEVLAQEKAGMGTQWLLTDHLGSTRDIVDNSGSVLNHIVFSSFGGIVSQSNAAFSSRYLYTQREFDAASGLNYYRSRYYDSSVGRFVQEDMIGFSNLFIYTNGNPISYADPRGLSPLVQLYVGRPQLRTTGFIGQNSGTGTPNLSLVPARESSESCRTFSPSWFPSVQAPPAGGDDDKRNDKNPPGNPNPPGSGRGPFDKFPGTGGYEYFDKEWCLIKASHAYSQSLAQARFWGEDDYWYLQAQITASAQLTADILKCMGGVDVYPEGIPLDYASRFPGIPGQRPQIEPDWP